MTPQERARLIAWAKSKAVPVASCVAARIRLDHLSLASPLDASPDELRARLDELLALVVVLADAVDPVALRAVTEGKDDGSPAVTDRDLMLRKAHAECVRLRDERREVPLRLRLLDAEYMTAHRKPSPRPETVWPASGMTSSGQVKSRQRGRTSVQLDPVQIVFGLVTPPAVAYALRRTLLPRSSFYFTWCTSAIGGMIGCLLPPPAWTQVAASGVSLIIAAFLWWLSRRRKRRAPKLAGAKSRALLAAVVRTMRERAKPRPVFRPQPQGASA